MNHIIDVLLGSSVEKIRKFGHDTLSTYGVGKGRTKAEWLYYGRELVSKGLLFVNTERFNVVDVTPEGLDTLRERRAVRLKAPLVSSGLSVEKRREQRKRLGAVEFDEETFSKLRLWRAGVAKRKSIPAYMVFSDATLQAISATNPRSFDDLRALSGIGEKKLELYGDALIELLTS
jgi:ATP-dependent DNA helicase RecQ